MGILFTFIYTFPVNAANGIIIYVLNVIPVWIFVWYFASLCNNLILLKIIGSKNLIFNKIFNFWMFLVIMEAALVLSGSSLICILLNVNNVSGIFWIWNVFIFIWFTIYGTYNFTVRPRTALCLSIKPLLQGLSTAVVHILILKFTQSFWKSILSDSPPLSTKILFGWSKIPIQYWKKNFHNQFFLFRGNNSRNTISCSMVYHVKKPDFFYHGTIL